MSDQYNRFDDDDIFFSREKENPFILPGSYFDLFADRLADRLLDEAGLRNLPLLSSMRKDHPLSVPENYFEENEGRIMMQYRLLLLKEETAEVPDKYFETLDSRIIDCIDDSSELDQFPLLRSVPKQNNFTVADDYFERPLSGNNKASKGKVINFRSWIRPAAAVAAGVALLACALWFRDSHENNVHEFPSGDCKTLACLEKRELLNEHTINELDDENLYEMVDVDALDKQLSDSTDAVVGLPPDSAVEHK